MLFLIVEALREKTSPEVSESFSFRSLVHLLGADRLRNSSQSCYFFSNSILGQQITFF